MHAEAEPSAKLRYDIVFFSVQWLFTEQCAALVLISLSLSYRDRILGVFWDL